MIAPYPVRIGAIVQARMGSTRLPGKTLRPLAGRPVLQYVLDRLHRCDRIDSIVVATSTDPSDDAIDGFCRSVGVDCIRGDLDDVAGRFCRILEARPMDGFVRVCADRPFLDQALIARGVDLFSAGGPDVVTNACPVTFPAGETVEIVRSEVFRRSYADMESGSDREHVTQLFYRQQERFRVQNFAADRDYTGVRLVLDNELDARVIEGIVSRMTRDHWTYNLDELVSLYHLQSPA